MAYLIELADAISPAATERVLGLAAALDAAGLPGVTDQVPGYTTLLVRFDPGRVAADELEHALHRLCERSGPVEDGNPVSRPARTVVIPVAYGGELGPDLPLVAEQAGLSPAEVITRHAGARYRVACLGFVPGFAYLVGLPPELATPRLASPRPRVPLGSVGIGGEQTAVYPSETPGGWNLIGRTPLRPFDPRRGDPFLLVAGDCVRFEPVGAAAYAAIVDQDERGAYVPVIEAAGETGAGA